MKRTNHPIGKNVTIVCSDGTTYTKYNSQINKKFLPLELDSRSLYQKEQTVTIGFKNITKFEERFENLDLNYNKKQ